MSVLFYLLTFLLISVISTEEDGEKHKCGGDISCVHDDQQCNGDLGKQSVMKDSSEATNIAQKAAQEAKAAEGAQQQAGQQAAHQVKEQLAEKAVEAAKAADAALAGKETIVQELKQEIQQADIVESEETEHLNELQAVVQAESRALQDAKAEAKILTQILHIVDTNIKDAEQVEAGLQQEVSEKETLVDTAKKRKENLGGELGKAQQDYTKTKTAAVNAEHAAAEAESNASKNNKRKRFLYDRIRK